MSDFRPMNECKGFNMERVLLKNKNGYMITAYFKDGMLQCDGDEDWTRPIAWDSFIRLKDLANGENSKLANCAIFDVSNRFSASEMAEWFHNNYEEIAKAEGWQTQDKCKVEFNDLPEKNKITMIKVCERWLNGR